MNAGDTFYPVRPEVDKTHLHVVISVPELDPENVVVVNIETLTGDSDLACVLKPQEHAKISRDTAVDYRRARRVSLAQLEAGIKNGAVELNDPMSQECLRRIQVGAVRSERTRVGIKEILRNQIDLPE